MHQTHQRRARSGLTLMELLLALAVLVVVAAMATPALTRSFDAQRLKKSADLVRAQWSQARTRAIREGQEYAFFYVPGSDRSWIAPFSSVYSEDARASAPANDTEHRGRFDYGDGRLPEGVRFYESQVDIDARAAHVLQDESNTGGAQLLLFYPDGTTQDAELLLGNEEPIYIRLNLRGLTGVATVSDLLGSEEVGR